MKGHKRQSNYVLQSENRGWKEAESQLGRTGRATGEARIAKRQTDPRESIKEDLWVLWGDRGGQESPQ